MKSDVHGIPVTWRTLSIVKRRSGPLVRPASLGKPVGVAFQALFNNRDGTDLIADLDGVLAGRLQRDIHLQHAPASAFDGHDLFGDHFAVDVYKRQDLYR